MNRKILNLLQKDARITVAEIARALKRSESAVRERIQRMEARGIIRGYFARVDKASLGYTSEAFVFCNIDPAEKDRVVNQLLDLKNVTGIFDVSGDRRILIKVAAEDNKRLRAFVHTRLIPLGIKDVESRIVMDATEKLPPDAVID